MRHQKVIGRVVPQPRPMPLVRVYARARAREMCMKLIDAVYRRKCQRIELIELINKSMFGSHYHWTAWRTIVTFAYEGNRLVHFHCRLSISFPHMPHLVVQFVKTTRSATCWICEDESVECRMNHCVCCSCCRHLMCC